MRPHEFIDMVAKAGLARRTTVWYSWFLAGMAVQEKIPGVLVECGVFAGTNSAALWRGAVDHGEHRKIVMCDSFEGIPPAGPMDDDAWQEKKPYGSKCSLENVKANMAKWGVEEADCEYVPGWYTDTLPHWEDKSIAVLRVDCDLYESTKTVFDALYSWLVPGGICIVDDYALRGCRAAVDEYFKGRGDPVVREIPDGHGPVWWRRT